MTRFVYYQDPGHGWVEVSLDTLIELGIDSEISGYSYISKCSQRPMAYLEEDCDAGLFLQAFQDKHGSMPELDTLYRDNIFIRHLQPYSAE